MSMKNNKALQKSLFTKKIIYLFQKIYHYFSKITLTLERLLETRNSVSNEKMFIRVQTLLCTAKYKYYENFILIKTPQKKHIDIFVQFYVGQR